MKIFNLMFSKVLGGIEQSFLDYNQALLMQGFDVTAVVHPNAKVKSMLHSRYHTIGNINRYDIFAIYKLRKLISLENPACIIAHSGRATELVRKTGTDTPVISISHNANYGRMIGVDAIIAVNSRMKNSIIKEGQPESKVYCIPNMIHLPQDLTYRPKQISDIPVVGMMARFEEKKGINILIEAISLLRRKGVKIKALIAGDGKNSGKVAAMIENLRLQDDIKLLGWISDKTAFYKSIDIFCLPSTIEPFGIVILEAFMNSLPVIATDTEGPLDIITHNENGVIINKNSPEALAYAIEECINNTKLTQKISEGGYKRAQDYSIFNISRMLKLIIETVCFRRFEL